MYAHICLVFCIIWFHYGLHDIFHYIHQDFTQYDEIQHNFTKSNRISWNPENSKDFMKSNTILLKATEFHRISWNQQDLTQFHKIQHNCTKSNRIYWNPEISKDFMRSNMILLKATEFYRISLNSLQISLQTLLQISLWMSFMDLTAYFITDFTADFITNGFHYKFHAKSNFTKTKMISWDFKWLHESQLDFTKSNKISKNPQEFTGLHKIQKDFIKFIRISLKSTEFHRTSLNPNGFHKFSWNPTQLHVKSIKFHYGFHDIFHYIHQDFTQYDEVQHNFTKSNRISWNPENSKDFMKSNTILLKATEFHRISWNQQDSTQFHKIQHNCTKSNRIYWNPEISKDFMRSNMILLKATEFYRISLNSLQISLQTLLQISLWMSFMDFTAYFITDFTADFITDSTTNFMLNPILLKPKWFHEISNDFMKANWILQRVTRFQKIHRSLQDYIKSRRIS